MLDDRLLNFLYMLEEKLNTVLELQSLNTTFKTQKDVAEYLGVTSRTIHNYIKSGKLQEGLHYSKCDGKTVFHTDEIINFKKSQSESKKLSSLSKLKVDEHTAHPVVRSLLKGL